jgi:photosystem II stability/assembly factor-like uncharacterized protein
MRKLVGALALVLMTAGVAMAERPGGFTVVGPGGGGAMFHPLVSPHDSSTALVACDMTGSYITHDGGRSWRMINLRGAVRFFVFDPSSPHLIYAANDNLWRSRDDGETWTMVWPPPSSIQGIAMASDHSDEKVLSRQNTLDTITALVIDPRDSNHFYASAGGKSPGLFESTEAGARWTRIADLSELANRIWFQSKPAASLLAAGQHFVAEWSGHNLQVSSSPAPLLDSSSAITEDGGWILYGATEDGITISHDDGATWFKASLPGTGAKVRAIATSLHHPDVAYASYSGLHLDDSVWHGVARTDDAGKSWKLVWKEGETAAPNVHDAWITQDFGTDWGENPLNLTTADQDSNIVYGTDFGRTLISTDGGRQWHAAYSRSTPDGGWVSTGLDVTTSYGIHFDPFDLRRRFITYTDISLFRSETGGQSWLSSSQGVPKNWMNTAYWMVFDPAVKGRAWAVYSGTHDLPRPKMWRHTSTDRYRGGVGRSDDGGRTWNPSSTGMPQTAATDIVLDPSSPSARRTLYVTSFGRGVYKSTDDGRTWSLRNTGIRQDTPFAWRITLAPDHVLYLVVARRSEDGSIGNSGDGAIYRSSDAGETWQPLPLPDGVNGPTGIAVDPAHPQRLYLSAWARAVGIQGEGGGVYVSGDGGQHWAPSLSKDQHIYDVTPDPRLPGTIYACGFESSAWVSRDSGIHWQRISGFNFKWGHRVVLDPEDSHKIYITTFGGGVWHGQVTTDLAILDIATPEMEPSR